LSRTAGARPGGFDVLTYAQTAARYPSLRAGDCGLVRLVVSDGAARGSAYSTMTGQMTGDATNNGALDAALGVRSGCEHEKRSRHHGARDSLGHVVLQKPR
jgi:hypothetical protein